MDNDQHQLGNMATGDPTTEQGERKMSYEGSREFLCANGHHSAVDCWDEDPKTCRCGAQITHSHSIDHTNGVIDDDPGTKAAPKEQIGTDDVWKQDHHGNRYAIAVPRYRPIAEWRANAKD